MRASTVSSIFLGLSGIFGIAAVGGADPPPWTGGAALLNGDVNSDGNIDLSDAVSLLSWLHSGGPEPAPLLCSAQLPEPGGRQSSGDVDSDGTIDLSDGVRLLRWLFAGGPAPTGGCDDPNLGGGASAHQVYLFEDEIPTHVIYTDPNTGSQIELGGFSGLVPFQGNASNNLFYTVSDRGPTVDFVPSGKAFTAPAFPPSIITVRLQNGGQGAILHVQGLRKPNGDPVSGIPNGCTTSEDPIVDLSGNPLTRDPDGLDIEGITADGEGGFWVCDEYLPSVARIDSSGRVVLRLVPHGAVCGGEGIPTIEALPAVVRKRRPNRGLEGIARAPNGLLYTVLQRPLSNPTQSAGDNSLNVRLLEIDVEGALAGEPGSVRQLLYLVEPVPAVTPPPYRTRDIYASDIFALSETTFLVSERRTDTVFKVDITSATDITGFEDSNGVLTDGSGKTIEQLSPSELAARGIQPVGKTAILAGLTALDPALEKVEGIAVSGDRLVLCPDNDFNLLETADYSTVPATISFQNPPNVPRVVTVPVPSL